MTCEYLADWMVKNRLLEYLYGDGVHAELLSRCASSVPGLLAEVGLLTEAQIDLIWKSAIGQHESILTEVYKAFPVIAGFVAHAGMCCFVCLTFFFLLLAAKVCWSTCTRSLKAFLVLHTTCT